MIYIVNNFEGMKFNKEGYFSIRVCLMDGIKNAKEEKKAAEEALQQKMKIYKLVEVKS